MPIRDQKLVKDNYYHLYNRGVNRQPILFRPENWTFFLKRLRQYATPDRADVIAYCLMPNHYHLLVRLNTDLFGTEVMQPFSLSYVKAINRQEARTGPLFEGPYQSRHVDRDEYLRHLTRYIHRNPVEAGLVERPEDWQFSSYRDYVGMRAGTFPQKDLVMAHYPSQEAYREYVMSSSNGNLPPHLLFA